jgi:hypothetical protein
MKEFIIVILVYFLAFLIALLGCYMFKEIGSFLLKKQNEREYVTTYDFNY